MTELFFGIYGFEFSAPISIPDIDLYPLNSLDGSANDKDTFTLTGWGRVVEKPSAGSSHVTDTPARVWRLGEALTFCQQQDVIVTKLIRMASGDTMAALIQSGRMPATIPAASERYTSGPAIIEDKFYPGGREQFLRCALPHLGEPPSDPALAAAFSRQVELWRLRRPYVEFQHFLAFSGLELLARSRLPALATGSIGPVLSGYLKSLGFTISQVEVEEWGTARNALFHRGELTSVHKNSGAAVKLTDQLYALKTLLTDCILKEIAFDDGHVNWNRWRDRMWFR